jgi:hypothetical protein
MQGCALAFEELLSRAERSFRIRKFVQRDRVGYVLGNKITR